jgi:lipopolysaccharide cholinephosphotransferase
MKRELSHEESKKKLIELLFKFDEICKENNVEYFLAYGALLGAVREKGFIPWDNDIDLFISRENMEKFITFFRDAPDKKYGVKTANHTNTDVPERMYFFEKGTYDETGEIGIYMDCFVLDRVADINTWSKLTKQLLIKEIEPRKGRSIIKSCIVKIAKLVLSNKTEQDICRRMLGCKSEKGDYMAIMSPPYGIVSYSAIWFENVTDVEYEGRMLPAPCGFDDLLKQIYGDYMTPPPIEKRDKVFSKVWTED